MTPSPLQCGHHIWRLPNTARAAFSDDSNGLFRSQCGRVTMLINNAGILPARPFLEFSSGETIRKIFEVNTYSQVRTPVCGHCFSVEFDIPAVLDHLRVPARHAGERRPHCVHVLHRRRCLRHVHGAVLRQQARHQVCGSISTVHGASLV